jgi:hypothetical protein
MTLNRGDRVKAQRGDGTPCMGAIIQIRPGADDGDQIVVIQTEPAGELVTAYASQCQPAPQQQDAPHGI